MSSEQKSGPVPLLSLLLALAYLVLRDVASAGGISALLFIAGGIALFALLFGLSDLLLRALPDSHERLYRRLSTAILVGVPAVCTLGLAWTPRMEQSPRAPGLVAVAALGSVAIAE